LLGKTQLRGGANILHNPRDAETDSDANAQSATEEFFHIMHFDYRL
jgi:hypothetical protein